MKGIFVTLKVYGKRGKLQYYLGKQNKNQRRMPTEKWAAEQSINTFHTIIIPVVPCPINVKKITRTIVSQ